MMIFGKLFTPTIIVTALAKLAWYGNSNKLKIESVLNEATICVANFSFWTLLNHPSNPRS